MNERVYYKHGSMGGTDLVDCEILVSGPGNMREIRFFDSITQQYETRTIQESDLFREPRPSLGLLMSIALRMNHALCDPNNMIFEHGVSYEQSLRVALGDARRAWEEVTGNGFYNEDAEERYRMMIPEEIRNEFD